jgi:phage shock protein PspC (stress-responsive transcriptional regulator)
MDKTIKINLGGILFHIDDEAFRILKQYLNEIEAKLKYTKGGAETIEDIESRIAEIFQSQKGLAGVITVDNVQAMITMIGKPGDFDVSDDASESTEYSAHTSIPKKLYRNQDDFIIGGVSSGIGAYLNVEPVWVRLLFVIFALFFGIGFFVYVALWIALPAAKSDAQKKEMYGTSNLSIISKRTKTYARGSGDHSYTSGEGSAAGNAINEVFLAIGKVFYIILRIFLIIMGVTFVISGFIMLVTTVMVSFFHYPGYFSTHSYGVDLFYLPDFINFIVNPAIAPLILVLLFLVILMPLLALIYWGIKMIFWFKAKDGIISLAGLVIWVVCIAILSLILFNEGIGFAETASTVSGTIVEKAPRDLYIVSNKKVSDLNYDEEITLPDNEYNLFLVKGNNSLSITTNLNIYNFDENSLKINIRKRSAGRSRTDAARKSEQLIYDYKISGDTLYLDEYFTIPEGQKWSFDNVGVNIYVPEGTMIHFDNTTRHMFNHYHRSDWDADYENFIYPDLQWEMTGHGLRRKSDDRR